MALGGLAHEGGLGDEAMVGRESGIVDQLIVAVALVSYLLLDPCPTACLAADQNYFISLRPQTNFMNFIDLMSLRGWLCSPLRRSFLQPTGVSSCSLRIEGIPGGSRVFPRQVGRLLADPIA